MNLKELLHNTVTTYEGPKLALVLTGGGMGLTGLLEVPGASKVVEAIHIPYGETAMAEFLAAQIKDDPWGLVHQAVSEKRVTAMLAALERMYPDCRCVAITAALTTNRWRKGEDHAWIAVNDPVEARRPPSHEVLAKPNENQYAYLNQHDLIGALRQKQDEEVCRHALLMVDIANGTYFDGCT